MSNNEKFNTLLNSCAHPRATYNALLALAPVIQEAWAISSERFTGKSDREIVNEIAQVVRRDRCAIETKGEDSTE